MINKAKIVEIVEEHIADSPLFLVEVKVSTGNQISVFLDGDEGVPISSCIEVSRLIESNLDREVEDFELEVSSVGVSRPLVLPRQFKKNIGRDIVFVNEDGKKIMARLLEADDNEITIEKELPKKKRKDKEPQEDPLQKLPYSAVKDVKVQVSFKSKDKDKNKDNK